MKHLPILVTALPQGGKATRPAADVVESGGYAGQALCALCRVVHLQRLPKGDLADGVRAHYKTVHPERTLR